jgi:hypothetical protein
MATKANISEFAYFPPPPGASGGRARWSDRFQLPELARLLLDNEQDWKSVDEYGVEDKYGALCKYVQYSFAYIVETHPPCPPPRRLYTAEGRDDHRAKVLIL